MVSAKLGIVLASVRKGRRGEGFAQWIRALIAERADVETTLLDLRDFPLPAYEYEAMPTAIEENYTDETARRWSAAIHSLDGFVFVTPEYNHGYPGNLKNAIDHVQSGWWYKPIAFVSYGGAASGGRAVEQLRAVAVEVRMVPVRGEVNLRLMGLALDEQRRPTDPFYAQRAAAMIDQLLWWARVSKQARERTPPPQ
jgi:NAD(P)H-dependent FMN reductase